MLVDHWETGFMAKIHVDISMMTEEWLKLFHFLNLRLSEKKSFKLFKPMKGWSVAVSFPDPIAIGNVQVFNARYMEISEDSRTVLFVSKAIQGLTRNMIISNISDQTYVRQVGF